MATKKSPPKKTNESKESKRNKSNRNKYNFSDLKIEFFNSDCDEVKIFFQNKFNSYNAHIAINTAGWTKEKAEMKRIATEKAIIQCRKQMTGELNSMVVDIVTEVKRQLEERKEPKYIIVDDFDKHGNPIKKTVWRSALESKDLVNFFGIIKTELGEPSKVTKETTVNLPLTDDLIEKHNIDVDDILRQNGLI